MVVTGLFNELKLDPSALGYAPLISASNDHGVADLGNSTLQPLVGKVSAHSFMSWGTKTGVRATIQVEADNTASVFRSSALSLVDMMQGAIDLDMSDPDHVAVLSAWVSGNKITSQNKADLIALATVQTPRNIILFGRLLTANDIAWVVRDANGTKLI